MSNNKREIVFNISQNFKIIRVLGEGAYGVVVLAIHLPSGTKVAIKKIVPFNKILFCLRTLREIKLLTKFRNHENIIQLYDVQRPLDFDNFREVYLIQEYMPTDLHKVIINEALSDDHIKYFVYQILRGLKLIHSANVIHRDLKPSNILINDCCDLKICDFGLSRYTASGPAAAADAGETGNPEGGISQLTEYVATRWYRAPEIMLTTSQYTTSVDMWSVGCILAELFCRTPIFPGKDYKHQLLLIIAFLGSPTEPDLSYIKSPRAHAYINTLPKYEPLNISKIFPAANPVGVDLLSKLLVFDPRKRFNVDQALNHPYLEVYHDLNDEPISTPLPEQDFIFDKTKHHTILELKKELFSTISTLN